jgi:hypothetical protein
LNGVREAIPALLDWFRASETLPGFLRTFSASCSTRPPALVRNGHTALTFACGHAAAGDLGAARGYAEQALSDFERMLASYRADYPTGEHWAPAYIDRAQRLIAALSASAAGSLLEEWRVLTAEALKIQR